MSHDPVQYLEELRAVQTARVKASLVDLVQSPVVDAEQAIRGNPKLACLGSLVGGFVITKLKLNRRDEGGRPVVGTEGSPGEKRPQEGKDWKVGLLGLLTPLAKGSAFTLYRKALAQIQCAGSNGDPQGMGPAAEPQPLASEAPEEAVSVSS